MKKDREKTYQILKELKGIILLIRNEQKKEAIQLFKELTTKYSSYILDSESNLKFIYFKISDCLIYDFTVFSIEEIIDEYNTIIYKEFNNDKNVLI